MKVYLCTIHSHIMQHTAAKGIAFRIALIFATAGLILFIISMITQEELIVTPKFHIATPLTCTSCTFIKSKKEDPTSKNIYLTLKSFNNWNYIDTPAMQVLTLQRMSLTSENISISGNSVQATKYKLFEEEQEDITNIKKKVINPPVIKISLSKYLAIPYQLQTSDGIKIQMKYFNDLEPD